MPGKTPRNGGKGRSKEQQSQEMRRSKLTLFIQQFEKEAQERVNELEAKLDNMLATVDKVFKVELMKMPPSLKSTLLGDLMSDEVSASDVSIAMKNESREMPKPCKRIPKERPINSTPVQATAGQRSKTGKASKRQRTLVGSNSAGNLGGSSSTRSRTHSCMSNTQTMPDPSKRKLRSVVSAGDMNCAESAAHVTVTTGRGETVIFSEETKNEINWDLLDDVAWFQIKKLTALMEGLSQRKSQAVAPQ